MRTHARLAAALLLAALAHGRAGADDISRIVVKPVRADDTSRVVVTLVRWPYT